MIISGQFPEDLDGAGPCKAAFDVWPAAPPVPGGCLYTRERLSKRERQTDKKHTDSQRQTDKQTETGRQTKRRRQIDRDRQTESGRQTETDGKKDRLEKQEVGFILLDRDFALRFHDQFTVHLQHNLRVKEKKSHNKMKITKEFLLRWHSFKFTISEAFVKIMSNKC